MSRGTTALFNAPPDDIFDITPNDGADLPNGKVTRAIMVNTSGNVKVTTSSNATGTLPNVAAGVWTMVKAKRVWATGTVPTTIVGCT